MGGRGGGIHKAHFYLFPEAICWHMYAVKLNAANKHGSVGFEDFNEYVEGMVLSSWREKYC